MDVLSIRRFGPLGAAAGSLSAEMGFWIASVCAVAPLAFDLGRSFSAGLRVLLAAIVACAASRLVPCRSAVIGEPVALTLFAMLSWLLGVIPGAVNCGPALTLLTERLVDSGRIRLPG